LSSKYVFFLVDDSIFVRDFSFDKIIYWRIHNGHCAIKKEVLNVINWLAVRKRQDVKFNTLVLNKFRETMLLNAPLIRYRISLSSRK
jgi:hypothetical protein